VAAWQHLVALVVVVAGLLLAVLVGVVKPEAVAGRMGTANDIISATPLLFRKSEVNVVLPPSANASHSRPPGAGDAEFSASKHPSVVFLQNVA
jgi:hypothetical protein